MAFVPFVNVVKLEIIYRWDNQIVENVLHYLCESTPDPDMLENLCQNFLIEWNSFFKPLIHNTVTLVALRATSLNSDSAPSLEYVTGMPIAGTLAGTVVPNNVTVAVKLLTNLRGRSYRGRVYWVGMASSQFTGNVVSSGFRTALGAALNAVIIISGATDFRLVVASRTSGGVERAEGVATPVVAAAVNPTLDSQRRRLPERGL